MSALATSRPNDRLPPTHLPLFLDLVSLDAPPPSTPTLPFLSPLYSLHRTLPTPVSLYSYLHAVLLHLTAQAATSLSFSAPSITAGLLAFTDHLSARLLSRHEGRPSLSSLLAPLVEALPSAIAAAPGPVAMEWVEDFAVVYTASLVSCALRVAASGESTTSKDSAASDATQVIVVSSPSSVAASSRTEAVSHAVKGWLSAVQSASNPCGASAGDGSANLRLTSRLLLAPLHGLRFSATHGTRDGGDWLTGTCAAIAEAFLAASCGAQTGEPAAPTCCTAFQHCILAVSQQWVFHLCTPPQLLPSSSPFPSPQAFAALLTPLAKALPPHLVVELLHDLVAALFGETSAFPTSYLPLQTFPSPRSASPGGGAVATCQRLHLLLSAAGVAVASLLERLLLPTAAASQSSEGGRRIRVTVAFLSSMVASGVSSMYSAGLQALLFQLMSASSPLSVPLLAAISASLRSPHLPLFEPTVSACRRWKERLKPQEVVSSSVDGQLLELVVRMAQTHRTISGMMGVSTADPLLPPTPPTAFTRFTAAETWLAVVSLYSANASHCVHALTRYCRTSSNHREEWEGFLRSSLNAALFQAFLLSSHSSSPELEPSSSSSSSPPLSSVGPCTASYHSLTSFLNCWVQRGLSGSAVIASSLEPLPASLSSLLAVSSSSTYVAAGQLRAALSSFLHWSPAPLPSRAPLHSFAPPDLSSLLAAVLSYLAALSSPFASCTSVISAVTAFKPVLPPVVVGVAVRRWLKVSVVELVSADEAVRRSAAKGFVLALLLCEELQLDADLVWDAELSDCCVAQLAQHCRAMQRRPRAVDEQPPPPSPLPPAGGSPGASAAVRSTQPAVAASGSTHLVVVSDPLVAAVPSGGAADGSHTPLPITFPAVDAGQRRRCGARRVGRSSEELDGASARPAARGDSGRRLRLQCLRPCRRSCQSAAAAVERGRSAGGAGGVRCADETEAKRKSGGPASLA